MSAGRQKRLRTLSGGVALLILVLAVFYVRPAVHDYRRVQAELAKMQTELQLVGPVFSQRQKSQTALAAAQEDLARAEARLLVGASAETLLKRFDSLARDCGVTLVGIKAGDPKGTGIPSYQTLPLHLTLSSGDITRLQRFLEGLENAEAFPGLTANSLQLSQLEGNNGPGGYGLELELNQLVLSK